MKYLFLLPILIILLLLPSCSRNISESLFISPGTIFLLCLAIFAVFLFLTYLHIHSTWKKLVSDLDDKKERVEPVDITIAKNFWKDLKRVLPGRYYHMAGFLFSMLALLFSGISMCDSRRLGLAGLDMPKFSVKVEKSKVTGKEEHDLVIRILSEKRPHECRLEYIPVFHGTDEDGVMQPSKYCEDFSHNIPRNIEFDKDPSGEFFFKIPNIRKDICGKDAYLPLCEKEKKGQVFLALICYKIYFTIGHARQEYIQQGMPSVPH